MKIILQRVSRASVKIAGSLVSEIGKGYLLLCGLESGDERGIAEKMAKKIGGLRVFSDENGKTNLSIKDVGGEVLSVSQFTLLADCRNGNRPSFTGALEPKSAKELYLYFNECLRNDGLTVKEGEFGGDMDVELLNEGPFTLYLDSKELVK